MAGSRPATPEHTRLLTPAQHGLAGLEFLSMESARSYPRHFHEVFGLGWIESGAQRSLSGRGMVEAKTGDLITVNPGEVHDGHAVGESGRRWHMLYLSPEALDRLTQDLSEPASGTATLALRAPVLEDSHLAARFRRLGELLVAPGSAFDPALRGLALESALQDLLGHLLLQHSHRGPMVLPKPAAVDRAHTRLRDATMPAPSLLELAQETGLSRFHVLRSFKARYGLPPHAFWLQCRLSLACGMLARGMAPAEVASDCGFADQSHLHRLFQRNLGLTPGAYRQAHRA